jgi:hypothetical protein
VVIERFDLFTCRRALDALRSLRVQTRMRERDRFARAAEDFRRVTESAPLLDEKPSKKKRRAKPAATVQPWDDTSVGGKRRVVLEE